MVLKYASAPVATLSENIPILTWETASDWDNAVQDPGVVHDTYGDFTDDSQIRLGYSTGVTDNVVYWPFDDGLNDLSGSANTHEGTLYSNYSWVETGLGGTGAVSFTDGYGQIEDHSDLKNQNPFTIECWLYPRDLSSVQVLFTKQGSSYSGYLVQLEDDTIKAYVGDGSSWNTTTTTLPSANTWYHWMLVVASSNIYQYLDGSQTANLSTSLSPATNTEWFLFGSDVGSLPYDGLMENVRIYTTNKSSLYAEISASVGGKGSRQASLTSATKSLSSPAAPDLQNLSYSLNSQTIDLRIIADPYESSEETVTQSLDGATSYSLSWSDTHTDFRVEPQFSTSDPTTSPTVSRIELVG